MTSPAPFDTTPGVAVPIEAFPTTDAQVADFVRATGAPGIIDLHVHAMPESMQQAVWRHFEALDPSWPVTYRMDIPARHAVLRGLGVRAHTALAYAHKPGVAAWLNEFTLALAAEHDDVISTFTIFPEPGVTEYVSDALGAGGSMVKVHLQVSKYSLHDPRLDDVWAMLAERRIPVMIHSGVVPDGSGGSPHCGPEPIAQLQDRFPELQVIVAHLGGPDYSDTLRMVERTPGMLLDISMSLTDPAYLGEFPATLLPRLHDLADRIVFGSDFPTIPHHYVAQVRGLAQLEFDAEQLRAVFHDRAAQVLANIRR